MAANFEEAVSELHTKLLQYIQSRGIQLDEKGFFRCINPKHDDKSPSCHIVPGTSDRTFKCFSCQVTGDIFHAAWFLEALPMHGPEFVKETLPTLCQRFDIDFKPNDDLSSYDLHIQRLRRLYHDTANLINKLGTYELTDSRNWSRDTCIRYSVGTVDWPEMRQALIEEYGYTAGFLNQADIKPSLFGESKITFTIHNEYGHVAGFAARNYGDSKIKFINTSGSKVSIYKKGSILYGLYFARFGSGPLIVTEGYPDVLTPVTHGFQNVVATCGTALTQEHVDLLSRLGLKDIVLCMDFDPPDKNGRRPGQDTMVRALSLCSGRDGFRIRVLDLSEWKRHAIESPRGSHLDLDEFFRAVPEPMEILRGKPFKDAFEWRLGQFPAGADPQDVCEKALPLVINESSNIRREQMLSVLSKHTGIRCRALQRELDSQLYNEDLRVREQTEKIKTKMVADLRKSHGKDVLTIVENAQERLQRVHVSEVSESVLSSNETVRSLQEYREFSQSRGMGLLGFATPFPRFNSRISGIPKTGKFIAVAGHANVGKTSWLDYLLWGMVKDVASNPELIALVLQLDDTRDDFFAKLVAIETGLDINQVHQPRQVQNPGALNLAWDKVSKAIADGRMDVKDSRHGSDIAFINQWLEFVAAEYPGKRPVLLIDNFHKMTGESADERIRFKTISQTLKRWCNQQRCTVIATMELSKTETGKKPSIRQLLETGQMEYDVDLGIMIQSNVQDMKLLHQSPYRAWRNGMKIEPVLDVEIQKNKISAFKGTLTFKFWSACARFQEIDWEEGKLPKLERTLVHETS